METIIENKIDVRELKTNIKIAAEQQRFFKNQRKTERLLGEREMPASEAAWKHRVNREQLRAMYAAYAVIRGKKIPDSLNFQEDWQKDEFLNKVSNIVKEYSID